MDKKKADSRASRKSYPLTCYDFIQLKRLLLLFKGKNETDIHL